ncbi:MAG: hypothetical protein JO134_21930 [Xanthobacteraceae bacterium]|nr:hypothetical protein [Xanthobacteraceae bacterium]
MKKIVMTVAAVALSASAAFGADLRVAAKAPPPPPAPASPWDLAFGGALMTDYIWRGITQSAHNPSVAAYSELRYNYSPSLQFYGGLSGESISFPNRAAAEIDMYAGVRPTLGPVAFDFGYWYYYYPGGQCFFTPFAGGPANPNCILGLPNGAVAKQNWSFYEVYAKALYTINPQWAVGGNYYYSPNILNTGAQGNYVSGTLKFTSPWQLWTGVGWYASGEYGEQFLGTSDAFYGTPAFPAGVKYQSYQTWNVGLGVTWKVFTLDVRYYDTNMTAANCAVYTSSQNAAFSTSAISTVNPGGLTSNWCGATVVGKLSFDMTLDSLK